MDQHHPDDIATMQHLFSKWMAGDCTKEEWERLVTYAGEHGREKELEQVMRAHWENIAGDNAEAISDWEEKCALLLGNNRTVYAPVHRVHLLRTAWFRYAAAVIIIILGIAYLWNIEQKEKPSVTQVNPPPVQNDVAPGGNRAMLTLSDGSVIVLDSAVNGLLAKQGITAIEKQGSTVVYSSKKEKEFPSPREGSGVGSKGYAINKMTTPRGGQYQITLSEGTKVWLNAESSITYPTSFAATARERRVSITGEAYFEVAKDKAKPFIVSVKKEEGRGEKGEENTLDIEVLGTHFNVNAYSGEPNISTTLLEGSVRLKIPSSFSPLPSPDKSLHPSLILKPGQQGQLKDQRLSLAAKVDVDQAIAWKNGVFNFNNVTLAEAMKQLARWYDVEVIYEGNKIPDMRFGGKMGRDLNLKQVLNGLQAIGVQFKIEGKKLTVSS